MHILLESFTEPVHILTQSVMSGGVLTPHKNIDEIHITGGLRTSFSNHLIALVKPKMSKKGGEPTDIQ